MKLRKTKETKKVDLTEVVDQMTDNFEDDLLEETREIEEIVNEEPKKEVKKELKLVPRKDLNKTKEEKDMSKSKRKFKFKFDMSIIIFIFILIVIGGIVLFLTIGNGGNKYGERLKGIDKISFTKKDKNKYVESIKSNERVNSVSLDIQGKLIYVIVDVKEDVSVEDAQNILNESLGNLSDEVKGFYDINALVTKKDEVPTEEIKTDSEGKETKIENKNFPISGYKNNSSENLVWKK